MSDKYRLDGKTPVMEPDLLKWGAWFEGADRHVQNDNLTIDGKIIHVSTVFLGLDHNFTGGKPILFEIMIFGGAHNDFQERYSTWEEAEEGHKNALELVREKQ